MIKFPKMSVATSTVNRILNIWDEVDQLALAAPLPAAQPYVPDTAAQGAQLDAALSQPVAGDAGPAGAAVAEGAAAGRSPLDALLTQPGATP